MRPLGVLCAIALPLGNGEKVTPVAKVLQMLTQLKLQCEGAVDDEQKIYAKYVEWVDDEGKRLEFEIKTGKKEIEKLTAFIAKADNDVSRLGKEIGELDDDLSRMNKEKTEATTLRDKERADFQSLESDYSASMDALDRAIKKMQAENYDRPQAEMFLQRMASRTPALEPVLAALAQEQEEGAGAPAADAYQFQSDGIVEMMEKFQEKFKSELTEAQRVESNKQQNYDLTMVHLTDGIKHAEEQQQEKSAEKGRRSSVSERAKGELVETKVALAEDVKFLSDMKVTFEEKLETYKSNQKVRKDELAAISKATEIISTGTSFIDEYKEHVNFTQVSFLQTGSRRIVATQRAATYLRQRAQALSSRTLSTVLAKMEADPFAKVVQMIQDLIAKLKEESAEEEDHQKWCDAQLKENKMKREKKGMQHNKLEAEIEDLAAKISKMADEIAELTGAQADLVKAMKEATAARNAEKHKNEKVLKDATRATVAVKQALVVLRDFYSAQASLLQAGQAPQIEAYKGASGASGGVIGMLEVIESDFVRLTAETNSAERQAALQYDEFMKDAKEDKEAKHDLEVKTKLDKDQAEFDVSNAKKDLASTAEELSKAESYFEQLKPQCLEVNVSYEDRVRRRKEEIEALKQAYRILDEK